jgi:hypothetical protein
MRLTTSRQSHSWSKVEKVKATVEALEEQLGTAVERVKANSPEEIKHTYKGQARVVSYSFGWRM